MINQLHAVYAKRNIEVPGMIWHRIRPMPWWAEELSGYALRIVSENTELRKVINHQIQELGKVEQSELTPFPVLTYFILRRTLS